MATVYQEFYCASSGGGCGGFITFPLNMAINGVVEVICPKCEHKHQRRIKDGVLTDDGRHSEKVTQEVTPTLAAWHKEAEHPDSKKRAGNWQLERQAVVLDTVILIDSDDKKSRDKSRPFLSALLHERFGGKGKSL